jgi:hypothetical protein
MSGLNTPRAYVNFCPKYFTALTLDNAMTYANLDLGVETYANMAKYANNQGHIWIHELFHVDWAAFTPDLTNLNHITDVKMKIPLVDGESFIVKADGPQMTKILARWTISTGTWIVRNADSLALYILAKYVQAEMDIYPHLPIVATVPLDVGKNLIFNGAFTMNANGTASDVNLTNPDLLTNTAAACVDPTTEDYLTLTYDFTDQGDYPTDYISDLNTWIWQDGNPIDFDCDCNEDGCSADSAPCCGDGSCSCDCGEDGCAEWPSCCASGTCAPLS